MTVTKAFGVRVWGLLGMLLVGMAGAEWKSIGPDWNPIGPFGGGKMGPLFVSGAYLFASDSKGVWRSVDRGTHWTCIQPGTNALYFQEIGTSLFELAYRQNLPPVLLLKSSDHGVTWKTPLEGAGRADSLAWQGIQESAFIGRYWVVTGRDGIYRSPDSGATWRRIGDLPWPADYRRNQVFAQLGSLIVVNESGFYRSIDSGASWQKQSTGARPGVSLQVQPLGRYLIAFDHDSTYRTSDFGVTWQVFHSPVLLPLAMAVGPDLYALSSADRSFLVMRSSDSGATWDWVGDVGNGNDSVSSLAASGDTLFAAMELGGVYRSYDHGAHFELASWPSPDTVILAANGNSVWAGTASEGGLFQSAGNGNADGWFRHEVSSTRIGSLRSIAFDAETILTAGFCCVLHLSRDGGASWSEPPVTGAGVMSINAVAVKDGSLLLAAGGCVYRFFDNISEWRCVQPLARPNSNDDAEFLVTDHAVFLGDSAGVFRSRDAGVSWDTINHGLQGEVHYLAEGGGAIFAGGTRGVFRSEDQGDSWIRMNPDRTRFTTLAAVGRTVFAGDDSGVSVSLDQGKSWTRANDGLTGLAYVNSLAVFGPDLYASADASIWKRPLSEMDSGSLGLSGAGMAVDRSLDMRVIRTGRGPAIAFNVPARGPVRLDLFDFSGRQIGILLNRVLDAGRAETLMAGRRAPGAYIVRLRVGGRERTAPIALAP